MLSIQTEHSTAASSAAAVSGAAPAPVRFGILCRNLNLQAWQVRCLDELLALPGVTLELIVRVSPEPSRARGSAGRHLLYKIYSRRLLQSKASITFDVSKRYPSAAGLETVGLSAGKYAISLSEADITEIRRHRLDFLLLFGLGIIRGDVLEAARHGVWSFHHDDEERYRGLPACFWSIYNGDRVSGAILQRLTDRLDGGVVLKKGYFRTITHNPSKNRDQVFFATSQWPAAVVRDIRGGVATYLARPPSTTKAPVLTRPTNGQMMRFGARVARSRIRKGLELLATRDQWNIGIIDAPITSLLDTSRRPDVRWMPRPAPGTFRADPFGLEHEGRLYVLFEEFDYRTRKGHLAVMAVEGDAIGPSERILPSEIHMSYPYLFVWRGSIYCLPECPGCESLVAYRATRFPYEWEPAATLLTGARISDATVVEHGDRWWMFCTDRTHGASTHLLVFHAASPMGPWTALPGNPVKHDVRSSRPAGTPFVHEGILYRPSQNCSRSYGGGVVLNRVVELSETAFQEEPEAVLAPNPAHPGIRGFHTLSAVGGKTLVDGKRFVARLPYSRKRST